MLQFLKEHSVEIQKLFKRISADHFSSITTTPKNRENNARRMIDELAKKNVRKQGEENVDWKTNFWEFSLF